MHHINIYLHRLLQIHIIRQLLGALAGAAIAFVLYSTYHHANLAIRAHLLSEAKKEQAAAPQNAREFRRIGGLAREAMRELQ